MGQHKHGNAPNYEAPVSFVTASNPQVTPEASRSFALAQRAAQALGNDPRVRVPSPPRQADDWAAQQREVDAEALRLYGQPGAGGAQGAGDAQQQQQKDARQPLPTAGAQDATERDDDDGDPLLEGLMNEAF